MLAKYNLQRMLPTVQGSCQWYAAAVVENKGNYREVLANVYHKYPTLIPASPFIDKEAPGKVKKLKPVWTATDIFCSGQLLRRKMKWTRLCVM